MQKAIVKESHNFEQACLKKKKGRETFWLFGDFLVRFFFNAFMPLGTQR